MNDDFGYLVEQARKLLVPGVRRIRLQDGDRVVEVEADLAPHAVPAVAATSAGSAAALAADDGRVPVEAPLVGTFYRAPQPGSPPFVEEGDVVAEGQTVGIVEAMKIMNPIAAPLTGRVVAVTAADGEMVEFGQPLMQLVPEHD